MITEMDVMGMGPQRRVAWLRANRVTLIAVGVTWIGMIAWELMYRRLPVFLIVMVPVFALIRLVTYRYYQRTAQPTEG